MHTEAIRSVPSFFCAHGNQNFEGFAMTQSRLFASVFALVNVIAVAVFAADQPGAISLDPSKFELRGTRAQQQLVVSGTFSVEDIRDLTSGLTYASSNPNGVEIEGTL